jgi:GDP-L-fucose synthase
VYGVKKIFYAGTVASYPYPYQHIPLVEDDFLNGKPHYGEFGYALAKRHALGHLEILNKDHGLEYTYGIITNLYGPFDKFNTNTGHVIPSLISKAVKAESSTEKIFEVWGRPDVSRDFMYASDAAGAIILAMNKYCGAINIASGVETTMGDLVSAIVANSNSKLKERWLSDQPIGIPKRYSDIKKLKEIGFSKKIDINSGVKLTLDWYRENQATARE